MEIEVEILEDGTLSVTTGDIPDTLHMAADEFIAELESVVGTRKTERRKHPFMAKAKVLRGGKIIQGA